ncbi:hypothetical protein A1O3_03152 [Capronia epimyces CBS 606.96]|uniref:YTH domain-containing protein n=1 Tax=Capronia epimyces CBS 606.96 TaxID=1182542 RepID=W9YC34_9EURO|nr:uncharacterized protein A1O3_03152 [Capronia epimyces CBS 606.96]EXJ90083.1 hypothetical protein A1O3_03152 [Capronia epimyces CBS 606.96]
MTSKYWGDYALWVGNIPPQATVMSLRDYFIEPSVQALLSISYNPDARYAFVNFSTEASRFRAIEHAACHLFQDRRLDCRIRQGTTSRSTKVNYGLNQPGKGSIAIAIYRDNPNDPVQDAEQISHYPEADRSQYAKAKYFIVKSSSAQALSQSLESGQWFVPHRHIKRLNHAFQTASKVYFIFSINGSRRFFGYAAMKSEIQPAVEMFDQSNDTHKVPLSALDLIPDSLVSTETETETNSEPSLGSRSRTPSLTSSSSSSDSSLGSIYYEPERRRIVWEAPHHDLTSPVAAAEEQEQSCGFRNPRTCPSPASTVGEERLRWTDLPTPRMGEAHLRLTDIPTPTPGSTLPTQVAAPFSPFSAFSPFKAEESSQSISRPSRIPFSSPCQVKWLSVQNVSFNVVKGLKNRWNGNKEVYIARNVTAVEPSAGATLLEILDSFKGLSRTVTSWPGL